jgi:mitogen-activated protein kinase 15
VAIKKIFNAYSNPIDSKRTWREIYFLCELKHPNIVRVQRVIKALNDRDIYIVAEFIESDLHAVIRADICEEVQRKYITFSILRGLMHMHSLGVIHRDIKPSNILINRDCLVKIADFSLARYIGLDINQYGQSVSMTDYMAARWYRAPEILLGSQHYDDKVDMWGVGCIIAELYLNRPLFPGSSTLN